MNRALIGVVAFVAVAALAGCGFPWPGAVTGPMGGPTGGPPPTCGPPMCGPKGSIVWAGGGALTDNANDSFVAWGEIKVSGTERAVEIPVPIGGTLSDLNVHLSAAPGTGASWTLTVDKNESATVLTCSIAGPATTCADSSFVSVVAGDRIDLHVTPFGSPSLASITWSVKITP